MNYRDAVLLDGYATGDADTTQIVDLKGLNPISEIVIVYKGTNSTSTPTEHPAKLITQVQVVDGSQVIADVDGKQLQALGYYHYKAAGVQGLNYIDNNQCWVSLRLPFGRWGFDPMLALDPARFHNPQLIIKTDHDAGGGAPDAGSLEVVARVFDAKKITPVGYLRTREHFRYSVVASGVETVDLPTDLPIKMLMFQGNYDSYALIQQINKIKLSEDNDSKVPLENSASDIIKMLAADLPPWIEKLRGNATTSQVKFFGTCFYEQSVMLVGIMSTINYGDTTQLDGGSFYVDMVTAAEFDGLLTGYCPHGCIGLEFGDPWDLDDWYNLSAVKSLQAKITAGSGASSSGTNKVVTQQLQKY